MIRYFYLCVLLIFLFGILSASDNDQESPVRSSVRFYRNIDQIEFVDWEKNFFKFPEVEKIEKKENERDVKVDPVPDVPAKKRVKTPKINKKNVSESKLFKLSKQRESYKDRSSDREETTDKITETAIKPEISENHIQKKRKEIQENTVEKTVNIDKKPVPESDAEENDEEQVDSSERIRKMKEMLRKKKRNRRIEDRRVY